MDALVGKAVTLRFDLQDSTGALPPVDNSCTYTLFDHAGSVLEGPTLVTTTTATSSVSIPLDASNQTISGTKRFEKRLVRLEWLSDGDTHSRSKSYRVIPLLNTSVTPDTVRGLIGLNIDELMDDEIDIVSAYFNVEDEVSKAVLDAVIQDGTVKELGAEKAIAAQAALQVLPGLPLRAAVSVSDGVETFQRFTGANFERIEAAIRGIRTAGINTLLEVEEAISLGVAFASRTDPITGVAP